MISRGRLRVSAPSLSEAAMSLRQRAAVGPPRLCAPALREVKLAIQSRPCAVGVAGDVCARLMLWYCEGSSGHPCRWRSGSCARRPSLYGGWYAHSPATIGKRLREVYLSPEQLAICRANPAAALTIVGPDATPLSAMWSLPEETRRAFSTCARTRIKSSIRGSVRKRVG